MLTALRRTLIGTPLPSEHIIHERLGKIQALAVLSSDALSSVAYATEEILLVLILAGSGALGLSWPIAEEGDYVTVVVPEFVPTRWWHHLLHNQTAWALKVALLYTRRGRQGRFRIITDVPFYLTR